MGKFRPDRAERRISAFSNYLSIAAGVAGLMFTIVALLNTYRDTQAQREEVYRSRIIYEQTLSARLEMTRGFKKLNDELQALRNRLAGIEAQVGASQGGTHGASVTQTTLKEIGALRTLVEATKANLARVAASSGTSAQRVARLESVILADPQRAVAIPLMQRDIAGLDTRLTREIQAVQADSARVYDLMKWLVGLMALVSLSLIGTAVGNVFKREPRESRGEDVRAPKSAADSSDAPRSTPDIH